MKAWWKSKTLWLNFLGASVLVVSQLAGGDVIPHATGVIVLALLNGAVRFMTHESIGI